jgi:hypothetical protein
MKTIYAKLLNAKRNIGKVKKTMKNGHFKNTYADINALLEVVEPVLLDNGLLLLQPIINNKVITQIIDVETGDKIESIIELDGNLNPQQRGSQITYYRRYSLQSALSLEVIDDDGNSASVQQKPLMSEKQYESFIERLQTDKSIIDKARNQFTFTAQQEIEIKEIL